MPEPNMAPHSPSVRSVGRNTRTAPLANPTVMQSLQRSRAGPLGGEVVPHGVPEPSAPTAEDIEIMNATPVNSRPTCVICLDHLHRSQEVFAQWCGHSFHKFCWAEWTAQTNASENSCPFRCVMDQAVRQLLFCISI